MGIVWDMVQNDIPIMKQHVISWQLAPKSEHSRVPPAFDILSLFGHNSCFVS